VEDQGNRTSQLPLQLVFYEEEEEALKNWLIQFKNLHASGF
jgi:hypothetical protein